MLKRILLLFIFEMIDLLYPIIQHVLEQHCIDIAIES